jgi:hypothetical protein
LKKRDFIRLTKEMQNFFDDLTACFESKIDIYNSQKIMERSGKFVVQRHEKQDSPVHWDLMLEAGEILETYRIGRTPEEWGIEPIEAEKIFDHPHKFLNYEGPVNKGKGNVIITESGTYHLVTRDENKLTLEFSGKILKGRFIFVIGECRVRRG